MPAAKTKNKSSNAPAVQEPTKKTLAQLISDMKPEIARALPRHMTPERMARIATTALRQNPKLGQCTPDSFLGALMTAAQLGLEPNTPMGECYLVPYRNKNRETNRFEDVCTYIQGYRGLVQLAYRSGQVATVKGQVVHQKDQFDFEEGLNGFLRHKRSPEDDPGPVIWVYATVELKNGGSNFVVMTKAEVERIRARSRASESGPWVTDWEAMAKKTALKQLSKWMPLSPEFAVASNLDETVRRDMNTTLVDVQPDYVDGEVISEPVATDSVPGEAAPDEPAEPPASEPIPERAQAVADAQDKLDTEAEPESEPEQNAAGPDVPQQKPMADGTRKKWTNRMFALFKEADCGDRQDQLIVLRAIADERDGVFVEVEHRDQLSDDELRTAVNTLNEWQKAGTLGDQITEVLQAYVAALADEEAPTSAGEPADSENDSPATEQEG